MKTENENYKQIMIDLFIEYAHLMELSPKTAKRLITKKVKNDKSFNEIIKNFNKSDHVTFYEFVKSELTQN